MPDNSERQKDIENALEARDRRGRNTTLLVGLVAAIVVFVGSLAYGGSFGVSLFWAGAAYVGIVGATSFR